MELQQPAPSPPIGEPRFRYPRATAGKRLLNYLIDAVAFYAVFIGIVYGLAHLALSFQPADDFLESFYVDLLFYALMLGYYFVMELVLGRTLGKILTNTLVLNLDDGHPSWKQVLGRSLCRFIPFEAFTFLNSRTSGWHDTIPKTKVVDTGKPPTVSHDTIATPTPAGETLPGQGEAPPPPTWGNTDQIRKSSKKIIRGSTSRSLYSPHG